MQMNPPAGIQDCGVSADCMVEQVQGFRGEGFRV